MKGVCSPGLYPWDTASREEPLGMLCRVSVRRIKSTYFKVSIHRSGFVFFFFLERPGNPWSKERDKILRVLYCSKYSGEWG